MDKKFLDHLIGEIDYLMERSRWQSKYQSRIAEKEVEASAERIDICRRGGGALLLLCELFGEKAQEVPEYDGLREIVQTIDAVVATLPVQAQALVAERYGLNVETALSNVGMTDDGKLQLREVLRKLKRSRRLRHLRRLIG